MALLLRHPRPLSTVAESPLTSDIDETDWGLSRSGHGSGGRLSAVGSYSSGPDDEMKSPRDRRPPPRFAELDTRPPG